MAEDGKHTAGPVEIIKTYQGNDIGASQCLVTLEDFIGDMDNAELADDSTVDTGDAVTAINGLIWSLERRDAEIVRLGDAHDELVAALQMLEDAELSRQDCDECEGEGEPEACGKCFPKFDAARIARRAALSKAKG